jgi:hypothetical protein
LFLCDFGESLLKVNAELINSTPCCAQSSNLVFVLSIFKSFFISTKIFFKLSLAFLLSPKLKANPSARPGVG